MKNYIKRHLYLLDAKAKKTIPILILAFILSSLLDVVGIGLISVFLGLLASPQLFIQKLSSVNNYFAGLTEHKLIVSAGILIIFAIAFKTVVALVVQAKVVTFCQSFSIRLKSRMMAAFQYAPYAYHLQKNSAYSQTRVQGSVSYYVNGVLSPTLSLISNILITLSILILLLVFHPILTLFLMIMFASIGIGYDLFSRKKISLMGRVIASIEGDIIKNINSGLHGLVEIRVLGKENYFLTRLHDDLKQYAKAAGVITALQQVPRYLIENAIVIFVIGLSIGSILFGNDSGSVVPIVGIFFF